jgi:DNA polymerase-4
MPISEAVRRCPEGLFLPVRMERYAEVSAQVMAIFESFTPDLQQISVDEAFLDMTGTERLWGPAFEAARLLKAKVREGTGLGISIGVAPNHYIAKIASGLRKPDGLVIVKPGDEEAFMLSVPISKLWGAGEKTQARFRELGILSIAQLASMGREALWSLFGKSGGDFLYDASRGRDPGIFGGNERGSRSMSGETTFERDLADREVLESVLMGIADELAFRLWTGGLRSRGLVLKLRFYDFTTISRRMRRESQYASAADAFADAKLLLDKAWDGRTEIRLIGLGFADLEETGGSEQGELFEDRSEKRRKAEEAVFRIEQEGRGKVTRARLLGKDRRGRPEAEYPPGRE